MAAISAYSEKRGVNYDVFTIRGWDYFGYALANEWYYTDRMAYCCGVYDYYINIAPVS